MSMMNNILSKTGLSALAVGAAIALSPMTAEAATLSISGGEEISLPSDFDLGGETGLADGTKIRSFDSVNIAGNGLIVSPATRLRFTFLGKEAGATNLTFAALDPTSAVNTPSGNVVQLFNNQTTAEGASVERMNDAGFVNFFFETSGLSDAPNNETNGDGIVSGSGTTGFAIIRNGTGADDTRIAMGLYLIDDRNAIALFGDGRGDNDYDDMALKISVVPLPAGGLLLLTALGGMAVVRRRRKAA